MVVWRDGAVFRTGCSWEDFLFADQLDGMSFHACRRWDAHQLQDSGGYVQDTRSLHTVDVSPRRCTERLNSPQFICNMLTGIATYQCPFILGI